MRRLQPEQTSAERDHQDILAGRRAVPAADADRLDLRHELRADALARQWWLPSALGADGALGARPASSTSMAERSVGVPMIELEGSPRPSPCTTRVAPSIRVHRRRAAGGRARRVRRADRAVRLRQVDADAHDLGQLPGRFGADRRRRRGRRPRRARARSWRCGGARSAMSASSCASCRACRRWTWSPSRCWRWAWTGREARPRAAALLARLRIPRGAVGALAHHLLGRRAAAGEHRARLRAPLPGAAARRADRLARRGQPRRRCWS